MTVLFLRRLAVAGVVAGAGLFGTAGVASAATTTSSCVARDGLTETAHSTFYDTGTPGESAGDRVTFHNEVANAAGVQIGTTDGAAQLFADPDGSLYERIVAVDSLSDGRVSWAGKVYIASAGSGADQVATAVGLTGVYAGKTGSRHFRVVGSPAPGVTTFASSLKVCG